MSHELVQRLLSLWTEPVPAGAEGEARFATCYAEQLTVNGVPFGRADLVARARALQASYSGIRCELLEEVETPDRLVIGFVMHVRQTGPLTTPLGVLEPTGRSAAVRTIDILAVRDGLITDITVVADELGLLTQLEAVRLT
ncbi:ester cyclase [Actinoplanes sp. NPDC051633]|uniref:ester cyclase n=1 Tax=Actinoplanes sp. NPDC051633 TaxID=3155670 RepID=UPI0034248614